MMDTEDIPALAKQVLDFIRINQGFATNDQALHFWFTLTNEEKMEYFNHVADITDL